MLQKLDDHIRECRERAARCAERARKQRNKRMRDELFRLEAMWLHLATSHEFAQKLEAFLLDGDKHGSEAISTAPAVRNDM